MDILDEVTLEDISWEPYNLQTPDLYQHVANELYILSKLLIYYADWLSAVPQAALATIIGCGVEMQESFQKHFRKGTDIGIWIHPIINRGFPKFHHPN